MTVRELDEKYVASTYARFPVCLKSGKGSLVYDENGKEYIGQTNQPNKPLHSVHPPYCFTPLTIIILSHEIPITSIYTSAIIIHRRSRWFFIYGQSPRILAAPSQAHIRSAICVGIVTCYP